MANDPRILCPELIGRDEELAALAAHLASITADTGRTVLLAGDAGVGKSALLRSFTRMARMSDVRVLGGECLAIEAGRPFGPFVQILRVARAALPAGILARSIREHAPELARLLPELDLGVAGSDAQQSAERYRIHESFVSLFQDLAARAPLVLIVEDLHWADDASLDLLSFITSRLRGERILFVATYRSDALSSSPLLEHALAELDRGRLADRIVLEPLDLAGTGAVVRRALGLDRAAPTEFVEAIHTRCEGNPFFIEEVLKALAERGDLRYADGAWQTAKPVRGLVLPDSIRVAVEQRMNSLPTQARHALQVAAVIGPRFDFDLLRAVSGTTEPELVGAVRAAIAAQLVVDEADGEGDQRYSFRHALTRDAVLGQLLQRERRRLHRQVADALEAQGDPARDAAELAYHFDEAGDVDRARRFHDAAGRDALRAFAFARALRHFERALDGAESNVETGDLHLLLARAAALTNDVARAAIESAEATRLFLACRQFERAGEALVESSAAQWLLGKTRESIALHQQAKELLEPLGDSAALSAVYAQDALALFFGHDPDAIVTDAERALAMARRTGNWRAEVRALEALAVGTAMKGEGEGVLFGRESVAVGLAHDGVSETQNAYVQLLATMELAGSSVADANAVRAERIAQARRHGFRPAQLMGLESTMAMGVGDWDAAMRMVGEMPHDTIWTAGPLGNVALMVIARDGPERGLPLLAEPLRMLNAAAPLAQWRDGAVTQACRAALLVGDLPGALDHAEEFAGVLEDGAPHQGRSHMAISALIAARRLGDERALARWIDLAAADTGNGRISHVRARRVMARAERAASQGDLDLALSAMAECSDLLTMSILQPWIFLPGTYVHQRRAELLRQRDGRGDRDAAATELAIDLPYLRRAKATWLLGQLHAWAKERDISFLGEDVPDAETAATSARLALTPREREVAILVARGTSNRAIATKLGITERTAEGHVEQVRNKLGFRSRAQVAAWVAETMPGSLH